MKKEERLGSIYIARCVINWKGYCGQTIQEYYDRIRQHKEKSEIGKSSRFYSAIRKHGFDNFIWCWLHYKDLHESKLDQYERYYIWLFELENPDNGYNMTPGGDFSPMKIPEIVEKARQTRSSYETLENLSIISKNWYWNNHNKQLEEMGQTNFLDD